MHVSLPHTVRRVLLGVAIILGLSVAIPASPTAAAPPAQGMQEVSGWFASNQKVVSPLQPVNVNVVLSGYTGSATLIVFDSQGRSVGGWEFSVPPSGNAQVQVLPRGSLGEHWAAIFVNGNQIADGPIYHLDAQTTIHTGVEMFDTLYPKLKGFMEQCVLEYPIRGHRVRGYRSPDSPLLWLRDHYYQGRGFRYFEGDVKSMIDGVRREQNPDGSFPDFLARPEYGIPAKRTPVEADVEYLYVLAVYEAWKMTGDDQWLISNLNAMQRAVDYSTTNPLRWEPNLGLVKRPYTIDTWDFEYGNTTLDPETNKPAPRHWIDEHTIWGIFHGDNTGLAQALHALSEVEFFLGQPDNAIHHQNLANSIMERLNALSWNGSFFKHHVKLIPWDVPGVDEDYQLSLSNALALNRGVLSYDQGNTIVNEYRSRLRRPYNVSFAEWWSIDPPFPEGSFGMAGRLGEQPGYYVNGGIMPLVGGELSRGAFRYGNEEYGFDILQRYYDLVDRTGATYLWYHPTGGPGTGRNVLATDGWGSSAMIGALMEGAAGIEDHGKTYSKATISPRWPATYDLHNASPATDVTDAYVVARYAASDGYVAYRWQYYQEDEHRSHLRLQATGNGETMTLRFLLPTGVKEIDYVVLNGQLVNIVTEQIGLSNYVVIKDVPTDVVQAHVALKQ